MVANNSLPSTSSTRSANPSILACYGCGLPGSIKSNSPNCKSPTVASSLFDFSSADSELNSAQKSGSAGLNPRARPIMQISIAGFNGTGIYCRVQAL